MRARAAIILNLLAPGSGLILLRRDGLGLSLSLLFAVFAHLAILGRWVMPASMPRGAALAAALLAAVVWSAAQWLLTARLRESSGPAFSAELASLCARSAAAIEQRQYAQAHDILRVALALDDEHPEVVRQWAELLTLTGRFRHARRAWRRLLRLSADDAGRRVAAQALAALPPG